MSYIRSKEIPRGSGNWYDYEVECVWENGKPRQKHIRYIGKSSRTSEPSLSGGSSIPAPVSIPASPIAKEHRITKMKIEAMKKGQRIIVRAFPNVRLERVVWEVGKTYVAVCRPEVYDEIKNETGLPGPVMGFPKEDVIQILSPA